MREPVDEPVHEPVEDPVERFRAALARRSGAAGPRALPDALAAACRDALPVHGVVLSVVSRGQWRLPVGASDRRAAAAERWQYALGQGPAFRAGAEDVPVVVGAAELRGAWPLLHDQLHRHTPYRSLAALPLERGPARGGVVDLCFRGARPPAAFDAAGAQRVAALVAAELFGAPGAPVQAGEPAWMDAPTARRRQRVWMVVSMARRVLGVDAADALALLRARAYAGDRVLEDLADDVVEGRVPLADLRVPAED
ncbi:ANTAR domain-containing protein [Kineococcus gypseus]|uniref:ANTAR domain-containing protein n=1 Tax=Kineococcus gypseus TaxID=1637102 RepID=UPI003D7DEF6D